MQFEVTQRYEASAEAVTAAYADPDLYPTLVGLPKLGHIEVLDHEGSPGRVELRVRFAFTGDLPTAVTAVVDPAKLSWVQETVHDLAAGTTSFLLVPDHYPDRLTASGTFAVTPTASGCVRTVRGNLEVHVLLVGNKAAGGIVSGLREYLAAEAPVVDTYVRT